MGSAAALATRQLTATALGVMTRQFAATAARSLGANVFTITPADLPTGLTISGVQTMLAGTQVEAGKYVDRQTYVATQIRAQGTTPGFVVQRRLSKGYRIEASIDSRYLSISPTLVDQCADRDPRRRSAPSSFASGSSRRPPSALAGARGDLVPQRRHGAHSLREVLVAQPLVGRVRVLAGKPETHEQHRVRRGCAGSRRRRGSSRPRR